MESAQKQHTPVWEQMEINKLIQKLVSQHSLSIDEYRFLIENRTNETAKNLAEAAVRERRRIYGNAVFVRGLIEITSYCKMNCLYCGLRRGNNNAERYRLSVDEILSCCQAGYSLGYRTFVLQGGEDAYFTDELLERLIRNIKTRYPDCAVTLSLGERSRESYSRLRAAGADRYLLRHETASSEHYAYLHPKEQRFESRMECLSLLSELGFQTGCGFMVGSPYQTTYDLARDLKFVEEFKPAMCGIGPFIPHKDTPFGKEQAGSVEMVYYLLSILRLIRPNLLLPATTALGTLDPIGREKGILSGANVVMPNLSPAEVRKKYMIYDNKLSDGAEAAEAIASLRQRVESIGYEIVTDRGDVREA